MEKQGKKGAMVSTALQQVLYPLGGRRVRCLERHWHFKFCVNHGWRKAGFTCVLTQRQNSLSVDMESLC